MYILLLHPLLSSSFFSSLSLAPHTVVPSAMPPSVIQVDEDSGIVIWQPPAKPNEVIQFYNIRISRCGGEEVVQVVTRVTETRYGFSTLGLSAGTYGVQVGSLFFFL